MYSHGRLLLRFALTTALVLWAAQAVQKPVITALLPVLDAVMLTSQQTFKVIDMEVITSGGNELVSLRANLAGPMQLSAHRFQPVDGWFEVTLTVGGVVSYALMLLIVILAWPFQRYQEYAVRLVVAVPVMLACVVINVTTTWSAELWMPMYEQAYRQGLPPLMVWSRFLMGGGGYMLALLTACLVIALGQRMTTPRLRPQYAQLVIPRRVSTATDQQPRSP